MAAPVWSSINMTAADGGLQSCFDLCRVHADLQKHMKEKEGCETLRDFALSYKTEDYVDELDKIWQGVESCKNTRVARGRLHGAWEAASQAIKNLESATPGGQSGGGPAAQIEDWEAPLPTEEYDKLWAEWKARYNMKLEVHLSPGDPLLGRIHREFRRWSLTPTPVEKWKSVLIQKHAEHKIETPLSSSVAIVENLGTKYNPRNVVEYYWGLRTLANAWAWAGNYEVESVTTPGTKVRMMELEPALNYADRCLRITTTVGLAYNEQLPWLARKDLLTRQIMANLVREKYPAGEALTKAILDTTHDWAVVNAREVRGPNESIADASSIGYHTALFGDQKGPTQRGRSRSPRGQQTSKGKGSGKVKNYKVGTLRLQVGSTKICGAYNGKRGCESRDKANCPQGGAHKCAFVMNEKGDICGRTDHGAANHGR